MKVHILNHHTRIPLSICKRIRELGCEPIVNTDRTDYNKHRRGLKKYQGLNQNYWEIFRKPYDGDFKLIIHDDIHINDKLFDNIQHILKYAPIDYPVAFYNPTNKLMRRFAESDKHVMSTTFNTWVQCTAFPKVWVENMMEWVDKHILEFGYYSEDRLFGIYNYYNNSHINIVQPSLIKHNGYDKSTFGIPAKIGKNIRDTSNFVQNLDITKIDWKKEFDNPFIDGSKSIKWKEYII